MLMGEEKDVDCGKAWDREQCGMGASLGTVLRCRSTGGRRCSGLSAQEHFWWDSVLRLRIFLVWRRHELDDQGGGIWGGLAAGVDPLAIGFAFFAYFLFSVAATIAASSANLFLFVDMVLIDILLLGLSLDAWGIGGHAPHLIAAYAEVAISLLSMYGAGAALLNGFYGRVFWPLGKPVNNWKA